MYIRAGMTYEQYWDGDCEMVKYYLAAFQDQQEQDSFYLWMQGRYFYEALLNAAPALNGMSKSHKPTPYPEEPYPLSKREAEHQEKRRQERALFDTREKMFQIMKANNSRFNKPIKEGGDNQNGRRNDAEPKDKHHG